MKKHKTAGPDKIIIEMLADLDIFVDKVTKVINKIYNDKEISRSLFIKVQEKPSKNGYEFYQTVNMCYITNNQDSVVDHNRTVLEIK